MSVRVDKWLWVVRAFKTRSMATRACRARRIRIGERVCKPSQPVRVGDVVTLRLRGHQRRLEVLRELDHRVGPKLVSDHAREIPIPKATRDRGASDPLL